MISIVRATIDDFKLLADIGKETFIESHGECAERSDVDTYVNETYSYKLFHEELSNVNNIYHIIYHGVQPAGYSKIIMNSPHPNIQVQNVTKLERLYLLKDFYKLRSGLKLFNFNVELSKKNNQSGIWLFVWKENHRAVSFYIQNGFKIIGSYDFKITETHSNSNHQMFLKY